MRGESHTNGVCGVSAIKAVSSGARIIAVFFFAVVFAMNVGMKTC